jgi:hypothetical protein
MKVKNLNGGTRNKIDASMWLAHWKAFGGQHAEYCFVKGCTGQIAAGGLVHKESRAEKDWFVVPLCEECNKKSGQDLDIWDQATLVSTNIGEVAVNPGLKQDSPQRAMGMEST